MTTPANDFYATAAQVIPTLLLVAAVEHRLMGKYQYLTQQIVFTIGALLGEVVALRALYVGGSDLRALVVYVGTSMAVLTTLLQLPGLLFGESAAAGGRRHNVLTVAVWLASLAALWVGLVI